MVLYQGKKAWQCARASSMQPKCAGKSGRYFIVLNCESRVVSRDVRAAVALSHAQIHQQRSHGLGAHAGTSIGMQGQLAWLYCMAATVSAII